VLAARWHCRRPGRSIELARARIGQGFVAGVLANVVGALSVTVLGTGLIALLIKLEWLRPLVYHTPHMSAAAAYGHVLHASQHASSYITMCVAFPVIGLIMSALGAACLMPVPSSPARSPVTATARQAPAPGPPPSLRPRRPPRRCRGPHPRPFMIVSSLRQIEPKTAHDHGLTPAGPGRGAWG
jgi:hypothetical protein